MGNLHPKAAIIQVALIHQFIGRPNRSPVEPPLLGAIGHLIPGQMCGKVAYHLGDVGLSPTSGAPQAEITFSGSKLKPYTVVGWLTMGNLKMRPTTIVYTDANGSFTATFVVPQLEDGLYGFTAEVGDVRYSMAFTVVGSGIALAEPPPASPDPSRSVDLVRALRPMGDTLVRVFHFDRGLRKWSFYDPRPIFEKNIDLLELVEGEIYWVEVASDREVVLDRKMRTFYRGWNLVGW